MPLDLGKPHKYVDLVKAIAESQPIVVEKADDITRAFFGILHLAAHPENFSKARKDFDPHEPNRILLEHYLGEPGIMAEAFLGRFQPEDAKILLELSAKAYGNERRVVPILQECGRQTENRLSYLERQKELAALKDAKDASKIAADPQINGLAPEAAK